MHRVYNSRYWDVENIYKQAQSLFLGKKCSYSCQAQNGDFLEHYKIGPASVEMKSSYEGPHLRRLSIRARSPNGLEKELQHIASKNDLASRSKLN